MGPGDLFPTTHLDLANIFGRMDLGFDLRFYFFGDPTFLDFQISKFPDFQVPRFSDAAGAGGERTPQIPPRKRN